MNRVIHFEVQADDVERAKEFYQKVFDWKISQVMNKESGPMDYWSIETGDGPGINGGMYQRPSDKMYNYDCTVQVLDIDETIEAIKQNGGTITREKAEIPGVGFFASAEDTEGNRFGIMQATVWQPVEE